MTTGQFTTIPGGGGVEIVTSPAFIADKTSATDVNTLGVVPVFQATKLILQSGLYEGSVFVGPTGLGTALRTFG
jgi:hypothetical protein